MTDVDCLYDKNPRAHPDAKAIEVVEDISMLEADGTLPLPFPQYHTNKSQYQAQAQL
jgi:uridylate kinase